MPGKSWAVVVDSPGFVVESQGPKPDGRQYLLANNPSNSVTISIMLESSPSGADPKSCPGYLHSREQSLSEYGPKNIEYTEIAHLPVLAYFIPEIGGIPVKQEHFVACTANDSVFVDIHISKTSFQPSERSLFVDILNSVHIPDGSTSTLQSSSEPSPTNQWSTKFFVEGSRYYQEENFRAAIVSYQAALDLEEIKPQLEKNLWRVLVDNLGMAYGITGDLDRSEKTYRYGIGKDPEYPGFYYGLACGFAERGNVDKAMEYLKKAFSLKANVIPGESMPDPAKDDSFKKFMSDEKFREFVKSLDAPK